MLVGWAACTVPLFLFCKFLLKSTWYGTFLAILLLRVSSQNYHSVISFSTVTSRRGGGQYITTLVTGTVRARLTSLYSAGYRTVPVMLWKYCLPSGTYEQLNKLTYEWIETPGHLSTWRVPSALAVLPVPYVRSFQLFDIYGTPVPSVVVPRWFQCGSGFSFLSQCGSGFISTVIIQGAKPKQIHADPDLVRPSQKVEFLHEK